MDRSFKYITPYYKEQAATEFQQIPNQLGPSIYHL